TFKLRTMTQETRLRPARRFSALSIAPCISPAMSPVAGYQGCAALDFLLSKIVQSVDGDGYIVTNNHVVGGSDKEIPHRGPGLILSLSKETRSSIRRLHMAVRDAAMQATNDSLHLFPE